jgi:dTDP-4-dehydrorhamnose reductase
MMRDLVFGPTGMLGNEMVKILSGSGFEVTTAGRSDSDIFFEVGISDFSEPRLQGFDYIVNCIGLITHNINESDPHSVASAKLLNAEFPRRLAGLAEETGSKLIQIATDCVFSGSKGGYVETDTHDATDVYGTTKSAGEVESPNSMHIRASIVGRELKGKRSLLEWVIGQPENAKVPGFSDRLWNGVTTTAFAKVVAGVISGNAFGPGIWHLVPKDKVSKFELVSMIASALGRSDLEIITSESGLPKDLTLATDHPMVNRGLWQAAGYRELPTIKELIAEIAS